MGQHNKPQLIHTLNLQRNRTSGLQFAQKSTQCFDFWNSCTVEGDNQISRLETFLRSRQTRHVRGHQDASSTKHRLRQRVALRQSFQMCNSATFPTAPAVRAPNPQLQR